MAEQGITTVLKDFPGHGDTTQDSHQEKAVTEKKLNELRVSELLPFQAGIDAGCQIVMMGHISLPYILEGDLPASLSSQMIGNILRKECGFQGIVITDAMNMSAITKHYKGEEAVLLAIKAGSDMVLMPEDFEEAYQAVLKAVQDGDIAIERVEESVRRILQVKLNKR